MTRPEPAPERLLAIYLRHHAAASHGGLDLFRRAARTQSDQPVRDELSRLAAEVAQDQRARCWASSGRSAYPATVSPSARSLGPKRSAG